MARRSGSSSDVVADRNYLLLDSVEFEALAFLVCERNRNGGRGIRLWIVPDCLRNFSYLLVALGDRARNRFNPNCIARRRNRTCRLDRENIRYGN